MGWEGIKVVGLLDYFQTPSQVKEFESYWDT